MCEPDLLERDAFVRPACGNPYPRLLFTERDKEGMPLDAPLMARTEDGVRGLVSREWSCLSPLPSTPLQGPPGIVTGR